MSMETLQLLLDVDLDNATLSGLNCSTSNYSNESSSTLPFSTLETVLIGAAFGLMIFCMIFGNLLVIMAIVIEKDLQRTQYYLILSLAIADLLVGIAVSPFAAMYDIHKQWHLGVYMCDFWTCMDVLACTSSILHLVAIALDRYWSITDVAYVQKRTPRRILIMIVIVWIVSLVISVAPVLGWKDEAYHQRVASRECLISQDISYQLFGTAAAFYLPLLFIIILYWKIYKAARHRIRMQQKRRSAMTAAEKKKSFKDKTVISQKSSLLTPNNAIGGSEISADACSAYELPSTYSMDNLDDSPDLPMKLISTRSMVTTNGVAPDDDSGIIILQQHVASSPSPRPLCAAKISTGTVITNGSLNKLSLSESQASTAKRKCASTTAPAPARTKREIRESRRERRAGRTLAIITGLFVMCWMPFFILAVYRPICAFYYQTTCHLPPALESVFAWLGYLNSALNPILYTIFSPDFRQAFKKILQRIWYLLK